MQGTMKMTLPKKPSLRGLLRPWQSIGRFDAEHIYIGFMLLV